MLRYKLNVFIYHQQHSSSEMCASYAMHLGFGSYRVCDSAVRCVCEGGGLKMEQGLRCLSSIAGMDQSTNDKMHYYHHQHHHQHHHHHTHTQPNLNPSFIAEEALIWVHFPRDHTAHFILPLLIKNYISHCNLIRLINDNK